MTSADVNPWEKVLHNSPYLRPHLSQTAETDGKVEVPQLSVQSLSYDRWNYTSDTTGPPCDIALQTCTHIFYTIISHWGAI